MATTHLTVTAVTHVGLLLEQLDEAYPNPRCTLRYGSPLELLLATILSAQCSDEQVNRILPRLLARFPTAQALTAAARSDIEAIIKPTGFYRQKARYIQMTCEILVDEYDGQLPAELPDLLRLPGVARKTANLLVGELYGRPEGVVVDTSVKRVARRLGLTVARSPETIERDLMGIIPPERWLTFSYQLAEHGRRYCHVRQPACWNCPLNDLCPSVKR